MHILPLNIAQYSNKNNTGKISFGNSFALSSNTMFDEEERKGIFHFSNRYKETKKYNLSKADMVKLYRLNDEDYETVMNSIHKSPKREKALLDKKTKLSFTKSEDTYNGITDKRLGLLFSNGYGHYSRVHTSNDYGDLHVLREVSGTDNKTVSIFTDKSRFNENYYIKNSYIETMENPGDLKTTKTREISIKDSNSKLIMDYTYSKKYFQNSVCSEFNINGRKYGAKIDKDGKVTIRSGSKWEALDFSKALKVLPATANERESFMEALKIIPPQMFPDLRDTLEPFVRDVEKRKAVILPYFSDAVANVSEQNRKEFTDVLTTIMPHMLYDLSNTISKLTFSDKENDEKVYRDFSKKMWNVPENKRQVFIESLKSLSPEILLELKNSIKEIKFEKSESIFLYTPAVAANSMINLTIERLSEKNGLTDDGQLNEIFREEKAGSIKWLEEDSDGHIIKDVSMYNKGYLEPEEEIKEVIKSVCSLLWMEEYEDGRVNDEGKRLLLNFFPETVSYIVSAFELNGARPAVQ